MGWPKSLRWRYSLRALLVFITLFMIWGGYHANRGWKRRTTESILRRNGADYSFSDASTPAHLRGRLEGSYRTLIYCLWGDVSFNGISVTSPLQPEVIDSLVALPQVESLSLQSRRTTSEESVRLTRSEHYGPRLPLPHSALERLLAHHRVRGLSLALWDLDDDDCRAIANHQSLVGINLLGCQLSEGGFARLLSLPALRRLSFSSCNVTGDSLGSVPGSQSLEEIMCYREPVGKEFAAFVGRSPKITALRVSGATINDEFVSELGAHPSLKSLELRGVVTDRATESLLRMPSLEFVYLPPKVSDEAIGRLKHSKPRLLIH